MTTTSSFNGNGNGNGNVNNTSLHNCALINTPMGTTINIELGSVQHLRMMKNILEKNIKKTQKKKIIKYFLLNDPKLYSNNCPKYPNPELIGLMNNGTVLNDRNRRTFNMQYQLLNNNNTVTPVYHKLNDRLENRRFGNTNMTGGRPFKSLKKTNKKKNVHKIK